MATKIFCDACGKEGASNRYSFRCHLTTISEGKHLNGYTDREMNPVSGRDGTVDLCNKCYNIVVDMPPAGSVGYIKDIAKNGIDYRVMWCSAFGSLLYKFNEDELKAMI